METARPSTPRAHHTTPLKVRHVRAGFTLLELLVAMSLMVIIAASLYTSMYTAFRARRSAEEAILPLQRAQVAIDMFVADVRGAVEPNTTLAGSFEAVNDRDGRSRATDRLTFYSSHHDVHGDSSRITCGVGLITLALVKAQHSDDYVLVREVTDNILAADPGQPIREVLCRHVHSLELRYFDGSSWKDQWNSEDLQDALPVAMEITLELEPQSDRGSAQGESRSRYDREYLNSLCRLTQIFTLPCGVSQEVLESAAATQTGGPS